MICNDFIALRADDLIGGKKYSRDRKGKAGEKSERASEDKTSERQGGFDPWLNF